MKKIAFILVALFTEMSIMAWNGSGTESAPYLIQTKTDMETLATNVNGGNPYTGIYFELSADIDLQGSSVSKWTPIGVYSATVENQKPFQGILNGNGFSVKGLYIDNTSSTTVDPHFGLFGFIQNAIIKNIIVEGQVSAFAYLGSLAGRIKNSKILNCINKATVSTVYTSGNANNKSLGGLIGYAEQSTIQGCENLVNIPGGGVYSVGGIVGMAENISVIKACTNRAKINASSTAQVGGIVGVLTNSRVVYSVNTDSIAGSQISGGLVGLAQTGSSIDSCCNSGAVYAKGRATGGIVGRLSGANTSKSYNTGNVYGAMVTASTYGTGGICGEALGTCVISDTYNRGKITNALTNVGGILGIGLSTPVVSISDSYNIGSVTCTNTSSNYRGGLAGSSSGLTATNSYYLTGVVSTPTVTAGTEKTTTELKALAATLNGARTVWAEDDGAVNDGFPILKWQKKELTTLISPRSEINNHQPLVFLEGSSIVVEASIPILKVDIYTIQGVKVTSIIGNAYKLNFSFDNEGIFIISTTTDRAIYSKKLILNR